MAKECLEDNGSKPMSRRRFLKLGGVATGVAVWSGANLYRALPTLIDLAAKPQRSVKANPKSVPSDVSVYSLPKQEIDKPPAVATIFNNEAEFLLALNGIRQSQDLTEVKHATEAAMFGKFDATIAIGGTSNEQGWEDYAVDLAQRITGIPVNAIPGLASTVNAQYGVPDLTTAKNAAVRTCIFGAAVPLTMLRRSGLVECSYVSDLELSVSVIDKQINNGVSAPGFGRMIVDCVDKSGQARPGVGAQWLHQFGFFLDYKTSGTPTTFNDMQMARLIPGMENIEQSRMDFPDKDDHDVFNIASTKATRFKEILSGRLILPGDNLYLSPVQLQQEMLLRRVYGTFTNIPADYFKNLTLYRRLHDDKLPAYGGQLA